MRGKVMDNDKIFGRAGITPAYAGKSRLCRNSNRPEKDHPRVCGEKAVRTVLTLDRMGSPPRMRGKESCGGVTLPF